MQDKENFFVAIYRQAFYSSLMLHEKKTLFLKCIKIVPNTDLRIINFSNCNNCRILKRNAIKNNFNIF